SEGEGGERPQPQQPTLRIALHIAQNQPIEEADWLRWLTLQPLGTAAVAQHAQRTLLVAEALGQNIPLTVWDNFRQRTLGQPTPDNPAWQRLIAAAAKQQNIPQTLALLAQALQNQPAHQLPPTTAAAGVQALQAIGQPQLALRLAMESILLPAETTQPETMNEPTAPEAEPPLSTKALNTNPRAAGEAGEVATPSGVTSLGQRDSTNLRAAGEAGESAASSGIMNLGERQSNNLRAAGGAGNKAEQAAPTPTNRSSGVNLNGVRATQEFNPLRAEGGAGHQLVNQASTINSSQAPTQEREAGMKASNLRAEGEAGELAIPSGATSLGGQESNNLRAAGEAEVSEEQSSSPPVRVNGGIRLNALEPSNVYEIYNKQSTPRTATGAKIQPVTISTPTTPQPNLTNTPTSPTTAPAKNPNKYQTTPNPNSNLLPPPRILTPTTPQKPKIILQNN
ncbi:MAG: hypothetical protein EBQ80_05435, partial [Proteobacteria bacterium]|nr:hypothetical protein [Pseudomonadota bacterium]